MQPAGGIDSLDALTALLHHQLAEVPFENTVLHYTPDRLLTLTPKYVYNKVVGRGHGGMCFQVTRMFYEILVALGYDAFPTCARLNVNTSAAAVGKDPTKPSFGDWFVNASSPSKCLISLTRQNIEGLT
jgi:arylamine N-acetyltransferase